jgi:hypothetical protein
MWQGYRFQNLPASAKHSFAIMVLLILQSVSQIAVLSQRPLLYFAGDSLSYLDAARRIGTQGQYIQGLRTPGFPSLLALLRVSGDQSTIWPLLITQIILMVLAALQIYWLAWKITYRITPAAIVASLIGCNLYILNWERTVLSETLAYWGTVTLVCMVYVYLIHPTWKMAICLSLLGFCTILIRPIFLFLPFVIILICLLRDFRLFGYKEWKRMGVSAVIIAIGMLGYTIAMQRQEGFFGISWISNINLFGKVLEYRLYTDPVPERYQLLQQQVIEYEKKYHIAEPWTFINIYAPHADKDHGQALGEYARTVIMSHIGSYISLSLRDIITVWQVEPIFYAPYGYTLPSPFPSWSDISPDMAASGGGPLGSSASPQILGWINLLERLSYFELFSYLALIIFIPTISIRFWKTPQDPGTSMLMILTMAIVTSIVLIAFGAYEEFYRLRFPLDWAMIMLVCIEGPHLFQPCWDRIRNRKMMR